MVSLAASTGLSGLAEYLGSKNVLTPLSCPRQHAGFIALFTALFAAIYKVLPDTPIAWRDVRTGAFLTALMFTAGKSLIGWYLGTTATSSGNGAAGALIVILLWTYYSAQIFLFGSEVTKAIADTRSDNTKAATFQSRLGKRDLPTERSWMSQPGRAAYGSLVGPFATAPLVPPQLTPSVGIFPSLLFFNPAQRPDCWGVHRLTLDIEYRAVTRAIPASFKTVPVQVTAHMGAACRVQVECPQSSRYAAIFSSPRRTIAPWPRFRSSSEPSSPGATYSAKLFKAVTFSVTKFLAALSGIGPAHKTSFHG